VADVTAIGFVLTDARGVAGVEAATPALASTADLRERIRGALDPSATLAFGPSWAGK
jgi:hypothetical protein